MNVPFVDAEDDDLMQPLPIAAARVA